MHVNPLHRCFSPYWKSANDFKFEISTKFVLVSESLDNLWILLETFGQNEPRSLLEASWVSANAEYHGNTIDYESSRENIDRTGCLVQQL